MTWRGSVPPILELIYKGNLISSFSSKKSFWNQGKMVNVIDAPQSGLKGFSQTLNKLLRCVRRPGVKLHPRGQGPRRVPRVGLKTRQDCKMLD